MLEVTGGRDEALLGSARALRRLGGRVMRLDADEGSVEGRDRRWGVERLIRIHAIAIAGVDERTRLEIESVVVSGGFIDIALGRRALRRVAREIMAG